MAAHLRLASLDGKPVPPGHTEPDAPFARTGGKPHVADHSSFRTFVERLRDSRVEAVRRGLLDSLAIVDGELARRAHRTDTGRRVRPAASVSGCRSLSAGSVRADAVPGVSARPEAPGQVILRGGKAMVRTIVAAGAKPQAGDRLVSDHGVPFGYVWSGKAWLLSAADAERRGLPGLAGSLVRYAYGKPLPGDAEIVAGGEHGDVLPF